MNKAGRQNDGFRPLFSGRAQLTSAFYDTSHFITSRKKLMLADFVPPFPPLTFFFFLLGQKYMRESSFQTQSLSSQDKYVGKAECQTDGFTLGYILPCHKSSFFSEM